MDTKKRKEKNQRTQQTAREAEKHERETLCARVPAYRQKLCVCMCAFGEKSPSLFGPGKKRHRETERRKAKKKK